MITYLSILELPPPTYIPNNSDDKHSEIWFFHTQQKLLKIQR